jgi:hypothetical protein
MVLATNWAQKWGIGQAKEDNGVIILVGKNERKIAIMPGYGLEDRLTAGIGGEIIRNIIVPEFKAGSYYNGLDKGADALVDVFKGKYKGERKRDKSKGLPILPIIIVVIVLLVLLSRRKNNGDNSGNGWRPSLLDVIILSNLGRSSGGGFGGFGGSSGGGFGGGGFGGGFGGGGFSGGGSSGLVILNDMKNILSLIMLLYCACTFSQSANYEQELKDADAFVAADPSASSFYKRGYLEFRNNDFQKRWQISIKQLLSIRKF